MTSKLKRPRSKKSVDDSGSNIDSDWENSLGILESKYLIAKQELTAQCEQQPQAGPILSIDLKHRSFTLASQCTSAELNIALIVCCRTFLYTPLQNFLCHTQLTVELTRVNIIYGWGGCGKSAVMYGLYVCLLGTEAASPLGRMQFTDFMKHDADSNTEITVKLLNTAQNAYKPDLFGPTITVKRVLLGQRRSSLLLISDSGHVVSRAEHESMFYAATAATTRQLVCTLQHVNIDLNNPAAMLNAANGLACGDAACRYNFFLRSTAASSSRGSGSAVISGDHDINAAQHDSAAAETEPDAQLQAKIALLSSKGEQLNDAYSKYLSNSNCTGHITLDHDKHTLDAVLTNADGVTTSTADTG
eukprot:19794-Heterococcus_DN1.PRE.2